jgi:hypothetical protein
MILIKNFDVPKRLAARRAVGLAGVQQMSQPHSTCISKIKAYGTKASAQDVTPDFPVEHGLGGSISLSF